MASCRVGGMRVWVAVGIVLGLVLPGGTLLVVSPFPARPAHSTYETSLNSLSPAREQPLERSLGSIPTPSIPASSYSVASTISLLNDTTYSGNRQFINPINPTEMTAVPSLGKLFVSDGDSSTISVLNSSTGQTLAVIPLPVSPNPWYSAYDPQNHLLYVDSSTGGYLTVVDTRNNTAVSSILMKGKTTGIAYDPSTKDLYVGEVPNGAYSCSQAGIGIVNTTNGSLARFVTTGNYFYGVEYDPTNGMIYGADNCGASIVEFDPASQTVVNRWAAGQSPHDIAYDPFNEQLFVPNQVSNNLGILNTSTGRWVTNLTTGTNPAGIAWVPQLQRMYVSNDVTGDVTVIDARNDTVLVPSVSVGTNPWGVAYDPASGHVFVEIFAEDILAIIQPSTNLVVGDYSLGSVPAALVAETQDGRVYVADSTNNSAVALNGSSYLGTEQTGGRPGGMAFDPMNHDIYVPNYYSNNITVISGPTGKVTGSTQSVGNPGWALYDPGNNSLYTLSVSSSTVVDVNTSNGAIMASFQTNSSPTQGIYNPGNHRVYISNQVYSNVTILNASTGRLLGTVTSGNPLSSLSQGIVYDAYNHEIYVTNPNTNNLSVINTTSNKVVATLNLSGTPTDLAYDSATHQILVTRTAANVVSILNASVLKVDYNVTVGLGPGPIAFQPYDNEIYVGNGNSGTVSVLSTSVVVPSLSSVSVSPPSATVTPNGTQVLSASPTCTGGPCPLGTTYAWSLTNSLGSLNSSIGNPVVFTARTTPGNVTVFVNATLNGITKPGNPVPITINASSTSALTSVSVSPTAPSVPVNSTQVFTDTSTCTSTCPAGVAISWSLNNTLGSIKASTKSAATFGAGPVPGAVLLTVKASLNGTTKWANATITITPVLPVLSSVSISPTSITVGVGNSTSFTAHPNCTGGTCPSGATYSWSLQSSSLGSITPTFPGPTTTFTAGSTAGSEILYATASLNGVQQTGLAIINITKGIVPTVTEVTLTPSPTVTVQVGKTVNFSTSVTCNVSPCPTGIVYNWTLNNTLGTVSPTTSSSATFTAGPTAGLVVLTVTASLNGGTQQATSTATITTSSVPVITGVTIVPTSATVQVGQGLEFSANATCTGDGGSCSPMYLHYFWFVNSTLGNLGSPTPHSAVNATVEFTAGGATGLVTLRVNATYNGKTVTDSVVITISQSITPPTNRTSPPTFLGLPGYDGYILLVVIAAVVVAAVVIALTRRKKAETAPAPSAGYQGYPQQPPYPPGQ